MKDKKGRTSQTACVISARLGEAANVEVLGHLNDEAHSRAVQFAIGMPFALQILGEQHVAWTEYARAARTCDLDRTRDRDDELALLGRVVLASSASGAARDPPS